LDDFESYVYVFVLFCFTGGGSGKNISEAVKVGTPTGGSVDFLTMQVLLLLIYAALVLSYLGYI
jgi:hypothetical protein